MRVCVVVCLAPVLGLAISPAGAQEAEVLRRDPKQRKQQLLRATQEQDQKMIQEMRDGPQRLEAQPLASHPPSATASAATVAPRPSVAVQPCTPADLVPEAGSLTRAVRAMRAARGGRSAPLRLSVGTPTYEFIAGTPSFRHRSATTDDHGTTRTLIDVLFTGGPRP